MWFATIRYRGNVRRPPPGSTLIFKCIFVSFLSVIMLFFPYPYINLLDLSIYWPIVSTHLLIFRIHPFIDISYPFIDLSYPFIDLLHPFIDLLHLLLDFLVNNTFSRMQLLSDRKRSCRQSTLTICLQIDWADPSVLALWNAFTLPTPRKRQVMPYDYNNF